MRRPSIRLAFAVTLLAAYYLTLFDTAAPAATPIIEQATRRDIEKSAAAFSAGEYAAALEPTKHLTERLPTQAIYFDRLARIQQKLGNYGDESKAWEGVFRTSPTPVDACPMLGQVYERLSDTSRAVDAYERCLSVEPTNPDLLLFLGRAYSGAGRATDAQRVLEQALTFAPDYPDVHLVLGVRNFADGRLADARTRFERFLELAPDRREEVAVWLDRTREVAR
jgi:tetratricopeptide (TPR) repeat protein